MKNDGEMDAELVTKQFLVKNTQIHNRVLKLAVSLQNCG